MTKAPTSQWTAAWHCRVAQLCPTAAQVQSFSPTLAASLHWLTPLQPS